MKKTYKTIANVIIKVYSSNISFICQKISKPNKETRNKYYVHNTMISADDVMPEIWDSAEEWASIEYSEIAEGIAENGYEFSDEQKDEIMNTLVRCTSHLFA